MRINTYTRSHCTLILRRRLAIATAALGLLTTPLLATDYTWTGLGSDNNWNIAGNWNPTGFPTTSSNATFPTLGTFYSVRESLFPSQVQQALSLTFDTTDDMQISFATVPAGYRLELVSGTVVRTAASSGFQHIHTDVRVDANSTWNINGTGQLTIDGISQGVPGVNFTKIGTGTLEITDTSGYSGTSTINAGTLKTSANGLGSGAVTVANGATIEPTAVVNRSLTLAGTGVGGQGALRSEFGATGWSGPITLSINSSIGVDSDTMTLSGVIDDGVGTRSITKVGAGTLVLSGASTYNGTTTVSQGLLLADNNNALGTGSVIVSTGTAVIPTNGKTISNALFLNGNGPASSGALHNQSGTSTWAGNITLQSNSTIGSDAGELVVSGQMLGNFLLAKSGAGTVTLANSSSTGVTTVFGGTLKLRNSGAISAAGAGVLIGSIALQETIASGLPINVSAPLSLNGLGDGGNGALRNISSNNTWSGNVTLQSNSQIGVDADQLTISGPILGAFDLTKVGNGTLVLTNTSNSYNNTIINGGFLDMAVPTALPASGTITVHNNGTLRLQGGVTGVRTLTLNGTGASSAGALSNLSGVNQWSAPITLQTDSRISAEAGELRLTGVISGSGGIEKRGAGKITLAAANTLTGAINVGNGVLSIEHSGALPVGSVTTVASGSAVEVRGGVSPLGALNISDTGILNTGALRNVANSNTWSGALTLASSNAAIGVDAGSQLTISSVISDGANAFPLTKVGAGTLVLSAANTYEGGTLINGGTLSVSADNNLGPLAAPVFTNNGGKLLFSATATTGRIYALNNGSLQVGAGATLTYSNATVNGGFLRGPGTHAIGAGSSLNGVTALNGTNITQSLPTTLTNFTNAGTLSSSAALTWDGGFNTSAGIINVSSTFNTQGFENDGIITVNSGGAISNSSSSLVSGGGARIAINPGGSINAGPSFELNGSLLVNNGTITGTTNVNFGSLAKGSGVYGAINVTDGGKFSPGNSPGSVTTGSTTWNSGGNYVVEISDALGTGIGWDRWNINGSLNLNATSSTNGRFTISLSTLDSPAANFENTHDYTWPILHASDGIAGFDLSEIILDTSGFKNSLGPGHFSLDSTSTDLAIHFSTVPEPSAMLFSLAAALISNRRGSRRQTDRKKV